MKKHKILKIILIIILVLLIIFIIHTVRNYIILDKIFDKELEYMDRTNLSYTRKQYTEDEPEKITMAKIYRKDNISMGVIKQPDKTIIMWNDNQANEQIITFPEQLIAVKFDISGEASIPTILEKAELNNFGYKLIFAMTSVITSDKVNDEDTYCVRLNYLVSFDENKSWVSKENGIIIKYINDFNKIDDKLYANISELTDYSFDTVTDEIVTKPNLTGYTVQQKKSVR